MEEALLETETETETGENVIVTAIGRGLDHTAPQISCFAFKQRNVFQFF